MKNGNSVVELSYLSICLSRRRLLNVTLFRRMMIMMIRFILMWY